MSQGTEKSLRKDNRMTIFWLTLGMICCLYGGLVFMAGSGTKFFMVWIAIGVVFFVFSFLAKNGRWQALPVGFRRVFWAVAVTGLIIFIAAEILVVRGFTAKPEPDLDYIIVLGAQIYESGPSVVLKYRLDEAADYLKENENTICIVSGGQGYNEPYPEAIGMKNYLVGRGIPESRILTEEKAENTRQNIKYSMVYFDPEEARVGIVTNDFHAYRGTMLAKKAGIRHVYGVPSGSNPLYLPNNMLREFFGVVKDTLL